MTPFATLKREFSALTRDTKAMALVEFALASPIFLALGFSALELANMSVVRMRVSQIGMTIADNAARIGETAAGSSAKNIWEREINDVFEGARIQGEAIKFRDRGRVVLSSLQRNASGGQWIAWQRCYGLKTWPSSYGVAGDGRTVTTFAGMGPTGAKVTAPAGEIVMFVEVAYTYEAVVEPIAKALKYFGLRVDGETVTYRQAFIVRDNRTMGVSTDSSTATNDYGLMNTTASPAPRASCS